VLVVFPQRFCFTNSVKVFLKVSKVVRTFNFTSVCGCGCGWVL